MPAAQEVKIDITTAANTAGVEKASASLRDLKTAATEAARSYSDQIGKTMAKVDADLKRSLAEREAARQRERSAAASAPAAPASPGGDSIAGDTRGIKNLVTLGLAKELLTRLYGFVQQLASQLNQAALASRNMGIEFEKNRQALQAQIKAVDSIESREKARADIAEKLAAAQEQLAQLQYQEDDPLQTLFRPDIVAAAKDQVSSQIVLLEAMARSLDKVSAASIAAGDAARAHAAAEAARTKAIADAETVRATAKAARTGIADLSTPAAQDAAAREQLAELQKERDTLLRNTLQAGDLTIGKGPEVAVRALELAPNRFTPDQAEALRINAEKATALQREIDARRKAATEAAKELDLELSIAEARAAGADKEATRLEWMREYNRLLASGAAQWQAQRGANLATTGPDDRRPISLAQGSNQASIGGFAISSARLAALNTTANPVVREAQKTNSILEKVEKSSRETLEAVKKLNVAGVTAWAP